MTSRLASVLGGIASLVLPHSAHAQGFVVRELIENTINASLMPLLGIIAVLTLVITGAVLASNVDEGALAKAKTSITAVIAGIILTTLSYTIVMRLFVEQQAGYSVFLPSAEGLRLEAIGIAEWFMSLAVIVAVVMILISSFRAIASIGSEAAVSANKKAVLHGVIGIIVIGAAGVIRNVVFFERSPVSIIAFLFSYVSILLNVLLTIVLAVVVIAALFLIVSLGNEANKDRAKGILIRATIGLLLVLFSVAIVRLVIAVFDGA